MVDTAHGADAEDRFAERWEAMGKQAWLHRLKDASDLYGRNRRLVQVDAQPADFIAAFNAWFGLVEVKSTKDTRGFPTSMIRQSQRVAAVRCMYARAPYVFAVECHTTGTWFLAPAKFVITQKGTILWDELKPYQWLENTSAPL